MRLVLELPRATWGYQVEVERRNRILVAVYAYAYEMRDECLVSDAEYDALARSIRPDMGTGNELLDHFFRTHYSPDTGMWIHKHPELSRVASICERYFVRL